MEFNDIIEDIITNKEVLRMQEFRQHGNISCYEHSLRVAYYCYFLCKLLRLDYYSAARASVLHDFYLYDWHVKEKYHKWHGFIHGKIAYNNAKCYFVLNDMERDIIVNHMFPLSLGLPRYKETLVITFVDKWCAVNETLLAIYSALKRRNSFQYLYIILYFVIKK